MDNSSVGSNQSVAISQYKLHGICVVPNTNIQPVVPMFQMVPNILNKHPSIATYV